MNFFERKIIVSVAGLRISEPKIDINIKKDIKDLPSTGTVVIYNLSELHENQIYLLENDITVSAGYQNHVGIVSVGSVQEIERERIGLSRQTRISIASKFNSKTNLGGITQRSYENTTLKDVVSDIVNYDLDPSSNLQIGNINNIPDVSIKNWSMTAPAKTALTSLLRPRGITWFQDDEFVEFSQRKLPVFGSSTVFISSDTGLIGSPTETDRGVRVRSLLNHRIRLGNIIHLKSKFINKEYKVVSLIHNGSNWGGSFFTDSEMEDI